MCRANMHERNLSRKFKIKQSGPCRVVALHKNCALLSDLEHNVLPDLKTFRALIKIDSHTETFPTDIVNCISFESQEGNSNCFVTAEEVPIQPSGFMTQIDCTDTKNVQSHSLVETVIKVRINHEYVGVLNKFLYIISPWDQGIRYVDSHYVEGNS